MSTIINYIFIENFKENYKSFQSNMLIKIDKFWFLNFWISWNISHWIYTLKNTSNLYILYVFRVIYTIQQNFFCNNKKIYTELTVLNIYSCSNNILPNYIINLVYLVLNNKCFVFIQLQNFISCQYVFHSLIASDNSSSFDLTITKVSLRYSLCFINF